MDAVVSPLISIPIRFYPRSFPLIIDTAIWEEHWRALPGPGVPDSPFSAKSRSSAAVRGQRNTSILEYRSPLRRSLSGGCDDEAAHEGAPNQHLLIADREAFLPSHRFLLDDSLGCGRGVRLSAVFRARGIRLENALRKQPSLWAVFHFLFRRVGEGIYEKAARSVKKRQSSWFRRSYPGCKAPNIFSCR